MVLNVSAPPRPVAPLISVIMSNFEAGDKLVPALQSVLGQSVRNLEVIVSDDASGDESVALIAEFAAHDNRVRLLRADENGGPAKCRNRAIEIARGDWIAIVDADDIIHPERFERLLAAAEHFGVDIVADDLLHFHEDGSPPRLLLGDNQDRPFQVSTEHWIRAGIDGSPALGYLKPMIRSSVLGPLRYDETLRIGEDHDLILRLLIGGASMVVVPEPYYLYRRHSRSISHRLSPSDLARMIESQETLVHRRAGLTPDLQAAFRRRLEQLKIGLGYENLVAAIKARQFVRAFFMVTGEPTHVLRLWRSARESLLRRTAPARPGRPVMTELVLGIAAGGGDAERQVPAYVPVADTDWNAHVQRGVWLDLAGLAQGEGLRVICTDEAGRFAAGFIPLAQIETEAAEKPLVAAQ